MPDELFAEQKDKYTSARYRMVEEQLANRDIYDKRVLEAMRKIPRHRFVPLEQQAFSYSDAPLPIGLSQTISQPYIVALMTQLLNLSGKGKVLEIGTGSGYQAAILACLGSEVHTIERHSQLAERAAALLAELNLLNVTVHVGDGSIGWAEHAPYEAILVSAGAPRVPQPLLDQLQEGGWLVLPVGGRDMQYLERWQRTTGGLGAPAHFDKEQIAAVAFVPLLGQYGWEEKDWD
jgi:protein-L-isoaspartate(D-aspartate) O-methyltransferase